MKRKKSPEELYIPALFHLVIYEHVIFLVVL